MILLLNEMLSNGCVVAVVVYPVLDEGVVDLLVQLPDVEVLDVLVDLPLSSSVEVVRFYLGNVDFSFSLLNVAFSLVDVPFSVVDVLLNSVDVVLGPTVLNS